MINYDHWFSKEDARDFAIEEKIANREDLSEEDRKYKVVKFKNYEVQKHLPFLGGTVFYTWMEMMCLKVFLVQSTSSLHFRLMLEGISKMSGTLKLAFLPSMKVGLTVSLSKIPLDIFRLYHQLPYIMELSLSILRSASFFTIR